MIRFRSRGAGGDLPDRLEALSKAVELADGRLTEESVAFAGHVVEKADARLRHGTTHTLVALLGATGSGKSSVANLVVGDDVTTTGVRRPTTSSTLALVWGDDDAGALLDWLEVGNRHRVGSTTAGGARHGGDVPDLDGLVLLDVPDHDSVAVAHRDEMERIAEHADVLLWVTDPEKYADKAMHDYLAGLGGHGAVLALALNKIDLLADDEVVACRHDLARLLGRAGLGDVPIALVSATTGRGRDDLLAVVADAVAGKQAAVERLAADASLAVGELTAQLGGRGQDRVPSAVRDRLAAELTEAAGVGAVAAAVGAGHRRDGARLTGWPFTRWVRRLRPHPLGRLHLDRDSTGRTSLPAPSGAQQARTDGALLAASEAIAGDLPDPWPDHIRAAIRPSDDRRLADRIDLAVAEAARRSRPRNPRWWTAVGALQWLLAAATVTGAIWLALLALAAYLRIPEPPTPEWRGFPIPTLLLLGGIALGLLVAFLAGRLHRLGARRQARTVRRRAERAVGDVTDELVIEPAQRELDRIESLHDLLARAAG